MSIRKKKVFIIATLLIIAAIAIVLCVNYITGNQVNEFEGTLVNSNYIRCI